MDIKVSFKTKTQSAVRQKLGLTIITGIFAVLLIGSGFVASNVQAQSTVAGAAKIDCDFIFDADTPFDKFQFKIDQVQDTKPAVAPDGILKFCVAPGVIVQNSPNIPVPSIRITRDNLHIVGLGPGITFKNLLPNTGSGPTSRVFEVSGAKGVVIKNLQIENLSNHSASIMAMDGAEIDLIENVDFLEGQQPRNALQAILTTGATIHEVRNVRIAATGSNLTGIGAHFDGIIGSISHSRIWLRGSSVSGIRNQNNSQIGSINGTVVLTEPLSPVAGTGNPLDITTSSIGSISNCRFFSNYHTPFANTSWGIKMQASGSNQSSIGSITNTTVAAANTEAIFVSGNSTIGRVSGDTNFFDFWDGEF